MKRTHSFFFLSILLLSSCSNDYTKVSSALGLAEEQELLFNFDVYKSNSQYDYSSNEDISFEVLKENGATVFKNLKATYSKEDDKFIYTNTSVFSFKKYSKGEGERYKYCYTLEPSFYFTGLVINEGKSVKALFYFPSYLTDCFTDSLQPSEKTVTFSDLVSFYEPLSNYSIDKTNQTINLEYYVRKDESNAYSKDTTYTLTLSIREEKVHLQKRKNA